MTSATLPKLHHIALTVTDVDASVTWYENVFGLKFKMDVPHEGGVGKLLADDTMQLVIVLHRHDGNDRELFGERVTGLDHVGLFVPTARTWRDGRTIWRRTTSPASTQPTSR
jgi:catechol 2,3-dioxygenase-like lactoylglutathione lyase family enzyme